MSSRCPLDVKPWQADMRSADAARPSHCGVCGVASRVVGETLTLHGLRARQIYELLQADTPAVVQGVLLRRYRCVRCGGITPDADAHVFSLDDHGLVSRYEPPALMSGPTPSLYTRDDGGLVMGYDSGDVHVLTHLDVLRRIRTEADDEGRSSQRSVPGDVTLGCASASWGRIARGQQRGPWTSHPTAQPHLNRGGDVRPTGGCARTPRQARGYDRLGRLASFTVDATPAIAFTRNRDGLLMTAGPLTFTRDVASALCMVLSVLKAGAH